MKRLPLYILIAIGLALLQSSFFAALPYLKFINFIILFLIYLTIKDASRALPFAIISGYILDIYSSYPFGTHILSLMFVSFLAYYVYNRILTNHRFFPIILLVALCIAAYQFAALNTIFVLSFLKLYEKTSIWTGAAIKNIGLEILYTVIMVSISYIIFYAAKKKLSVYLLAPKSYGK
ncbi:MAG: rod shape-determining protein MreD [bacterium]